MTNDRTAVAIRRHFLETADERPADGQLETILDVTSTTRQRPRWAVVALGLADPMAAVSGAALRFGLLAALLALALAGIVVFGGGSRGGTPFQGTWRSIDIPDGSTQTLVVGGGLNPAVYFEDAFASGCRDGGDASTFFQAEGPGEISSYRLTAHFAESGCITWRVPAFDATFDYDVATDTLLDHTGITWRRLP